MEELPDIEKLYKEYQQEKNEIIVILGINTPNREVETDAKGITTTTYFIDKNGKISRCIKEIMHYDDIKKSIDNSFK